MSEKNAKSYLAVSADSFNDNKLCVVFLEEMEGKWDSSLFDVNVAAAGLVFGILLNFLLLTFLIGRKCRSETGLAFLANLIGWLAFFDLLASSFIFISYMINNLDEQSLNGTIFVWTGSVGAFGMALMAFERLVHTVAPSFYQIISGGCCWQTLLIGTTLSCGCIFPAFSLRSEPSGMLFSFCLTIVTTLSLSCLLVVILAMIFLIRWVTRRHQQLNGSVAIMATPSRLQPPLTPTDLPSQESTGMACLYILLTSACWLPLMSYLLYRQVEAQYMDIDLDGLPSCSINALYLRLTVLPFFLRPVCFLLASSELKMLCHWCWNRGARNSGGNSYWDSSFAGSPRLSRSLINDQDSSTLIAYRRTSGSAKRSVCFQNVEDKNRSFFPDFLALKRSPKKRKNVRHWKRYSCSSCSEPMSLFNSSSSTSINYIHTIGQSSQLPNAVYKREMIARRSSAFKGSSIISSTAAHESSSVTGRKDSILPQMTTAKSQLILEPQTRRSSF